MIREWQIQEAKNKFSQVVKQANTGEPQFITVHGKTTAVVISAEEYSRLKKPSTSLSQVLLAPDIGVELETERANDSERETDL